MAATGRRGHGMFSAAKGDLIAPEPRPRRPHFRPALANEPVIDAEFEIVDPAAEADGPASSVSAADTADRRLDLFGRKFVFAAAEPKRRPSAFPLLLAGLCGLSFWVFGGNTVFARLAGPAAAETSLRITDVSTRFGIIDGMRVAIVNGRVHNASAERQTVPPIGISTKRGAAPVTVHAVADMLDAGESTGFRARLPIAGGAEPEVKAAFATPSEGALMR